MHKKVLSSATFLAASTLIEKAGGFLIIPMLTAALSVAQYGELMTAVSYVGVASLLFYNGLHSAMFRWYSTWSEKWDKRLYEKYIFIVINAIAILLGLLLLLLNQFLPLDKLLGIPFYLFYAVYWAAVFAIPFSIKQSKWIIDGKSVYCLVVSFLKTALLIAFVWSLIKSYPSPYIRPLGETFAIILLWFVVVYQYLFRYPSVKAVNRSEIYGVMKQSFTYGWSLQLSQIAFWFINSSDRIVLNHLSDASSVAYYSIIMTLGTFPMFLVTSFNNSFSAYYFRAVSSNEMSLAAVNKTITRYLLAGAGLLLLYKVLMYLLAKPVILIISTADYLGAAPWLHLTADILFFYFAYLLISRYLHYKAMTKAIVFITVFAAIMNVIGNIVLIPYYGLGAAIYCSIFSYFLMPAITFFYCVKHSSLKEFKGVLITFVLLSFGYVFVDVVLSII
jgi:O-antigen/teichoic acid export membrane protein